MSDKEKKKKSDKSVSSDNSEKGGVASTQLRISATEAQYAPMHDERGWFQGAGKPRLPDIHKDIRLNLSKAIRAGCPLFGVTGGIRVLKNANGDGGVFFIESRYMQNGEALYLFTKEPREKLEKAGLVVLRDGKGYYVKPRTKDGELAFDVINEKFTNNHGPMKWQVHEWPGFEVDMSSAKKKVKKSEKEAKKVVVKKEEKSEKSEKPKEKKEDEKVTTMPRVVKKVEAKKKDQALAAAAG